MRKLYSLAMYLALPLILAYLAWRGLRDRAWLARWRERFATFTAPERTGGIVVHAASVGEVNAAAPLVRALRGEFPDLPLTVTTFTPTGAARAAELFGDDVFRVHAPLDLPGAVARFHARVDPALMIIMETEIWPNLYAAAARRRIPILLANARISEKSMAGYRRWRGLVAEALGAVRFAAAQSAADAARLVTLGAAPERVEVLGNLKFEFDVPDGLESQGQALRKRWGAERFVVLAGSTHEQDEAAVLPAFTGLLERRPDALLVLVPRHPERFERAAEMAAAHGLSIGRHSDGVDAPRDVQCLVVDAMGELLRYYACCDVAIVGGSFARVGGHNVLEPAALGRPVIVGPHTFNFIDVMRRMVAHGAAIQLGSGRALGPALQHLLDEPALRAKMGAAGQALVQRNRGALQATLAAATRLLGRA